MVLLRIGRILRSHGNRGELKVESLSHDLQRFSWLEKVHVEMQGTYSLYEVEASRIHQDRIILKLLGVDTIDEARSLMGGYLCVPEEERPPLPPDTYYIYDLLGARLYSPKGQDLGIIKDVLTLPANDVLVILKDGKEYLIPALQSVIQKVDLESRTVEVDLPAGLLEEYDDEH